MSLSRYLTSVDAAFLYFEKENEPMHIGGTMVYEGDFGADEVKKILGARLHKIPRYRQKVVTPPFGVSHPFWVDDPDFDIDAHIVEDSVEAPGDRTALATKAAEVYAGTLDRSRPLWKGIVLRGLEGERTAVVWKIHHSMIDGVSGVDLTMVMNDLAPSAEADEPQEPWAPPPIPDAVSLLQEGMEHRISEVGKAMTQQAFSWFRPSDVANRWRGLARAAAKTMPVTMRPAPATPFNRPVGPRRSFAWAQFSLTEMRKVKAALDGTLNDAVLTVLSGGLRRYLEAHGARTRGMELRAMCPVSMRNHAERGQLGNLVSTMIAPLYVGIEDPVERFAAERNGMRELKAAGQAESFYELSRLGEALPPALAALGGSASIQQRLFNTVSTNVPGPMIPLYQGSRRLVDWLPMGICSSGLGLFVAILSYNHRITLGLTVDSDQVQDPWQLATFLEESYVELRNAAGVAAEDEPEVEAIGRRGSSRASRAKGTKSRPKSRPKAQSARAATTTKTAAKKKTRKKASKKARATTKRSPRKT